MDDVNNNSDGDESIEHQHLGLIDEEQALDDGVIWNKNGNMAIPFLTPSDISTLKIMASSFRKSNAIIYNTPATTHVNSGNDDINLQESNLLEASLVDFDVRNTRSRAGLFYEGGRFGNKPGPCVAFEAEQQSDRASDAISRRRSTYIEHSQERTSFLNRFASFLSGDEDMEHDDERLKSKLSEDTFSFFIMTPIKSTPYVTGWAVVVVKTIIYSLILANMLRLGTANNPLGIPASTEWPIIMAQTIAVAISKFF